MDDKQLQQIIHFLFPCSSVGIHTGVYNMMSICIPTQERGNEGNGYNLDIKNPHQPEEEKQYSSVELLDMLHHSFAKGDDLLDKLRKELV